MKPKTMKKFVMMIGALPVVAAMPSFAEDAPAPSGVMSFKDAAKIKSWDAWNDHKKPEPPKEKTCVTWKKLNKLDPGLKEIGRLAVRGAKDIKSSKWSVGCETMDRDYADWNAYKHLLEPLGAKHGRLFSGWAKTEQEKGVYDFTWLDPQVREMAAMGVKPWICLSYGIPVYGSDFRLGMRVKQVTDKPEAFEAWLRYVSACVERYKDVVDEWEIWNEPFHQGPEYAEMFYRTAKAIQAVQPTAKCLCTAVTFPSDYKCVLEKLKAENALDLGSYFIYHPYDPNPDKSYAKRTEPLRKLVKSYSDAFDIMQGEVGCPSQLEFAHAMHNIEWTEYAQAKWDLRRAIGDAVRSIPSSVFTMIDLQYTFMLQSFGLVRSNTLKEFVYRRPSYYAMQNVYSVFDDDMLPQKHVVVKIAGRDVACNLFNRLGQSWRFYWFCGERPDSSLSFTPVTLEIPEKLERPVWIEMITGRVFEIPEESIARRSDGMTLKDVPLWDSPIAIVSRSAVALARDGQETSQKGILDPFYSPGQSFAADVDVLVFTRWDWVKNETTGGVAKGGTYGAKNSRPYHHISTGQGAEEVRRYFTANGLKCLVTDNPAFFVSDAMKSLKLVFLCNCNHELFDTDAQRIYTWSDHCFFNPMPTYERPLES